MPRRVNLLILLGLIIVAVLSFGISASAAQDEGTTPGEGAKPQGGALPVEGGMPGEIVGPDGDTVAGENELPPPEAALEHVTTSEEGTVPVRDPAPAGDEVTPEEDPAQDEGAAQESAESNASGKEPGFGGAEGDGETFEEMLTEAEKADGAYKNALFEESLLNKEIAKTRSDLTATEDSLEEAQDSLGDRASEIYKYGQEGFVSMLLEAEDFREFADRLGFWIQLLEKDRDEVQKWSESRDELEQKTEELETQLQSWEQTREEESEKKEQAQTRLEEAQAFFEALDEEAQREIEKERASESQLALDHAAKLIQEADQDKAHDSDQTVGDEQDARQAGAENSDEMSAEEEKARQGKVAQAVADTILEWPVLREKIRQESGENVENKGSGETTPQNPAAEQMTAAAKEQAEAQERAKQAAEQTAMEKQAADEAATRAEEAKKARLAAQLAPAAEQEAAQNAAKEAESQATLAAERAAEQKKAAEEAATQAAQRLSAAEKEADAARQAAAKDPFAPTPDPAGTNPLPSGSEGGVLGEAKSWLGVPYDYSHMAGMTRKAVDCSAFTAAVFSKFGITLPDSPAGQWGMGTPVVGPAKAGDLVFFSEDGSGIPTHVGIANGDGTLTHASSFTGQVSVTPIQYIPGYMGARRLL